ncbi:MAG TPA: hypothetical protein VLM38_13035 [Blastocatellia bacterium]|nr:hypothetical protein [Blastocatellia bacterium]
MNRSTMSATLVLLLISACLSPMVSARFQEELVYHEIRIDQDGKIIPWYSANLGQAYDHNIRLVWSFWSNMRSCPNGVKYYLQHQVWKKRADDPRGLGGDQLNMALSSWNLLHQYLGDEAVRDNMIYIADYYIDHAFSKPSDAWPNVPYPYNTDIHSGVYDGDMRAGKKFFQPDKAASFGAEMVVLYKITGSHRYLDVATGIADTLSGKISPGDADHSPWPYRVNAETGEVHQVVKRGIRHSAAYTANWAPALRLYDDLIALNAGQVDAFKRARDLLFDWIAANPLKTNRWGPFFEDVPTHRFSDTEINADTMAMYILEHSDSNPIWKQQVESILAWSFGTFGHQGWAQYGVVPINEQTQYMVPGNSHTSRHASVELMFGEKAADDSRKAEAIRRLNWATYMVDESGRNRYPENDIWLTDGYGDYVRHYLRAMAAAPELAPDDQNHLLRTSSVIKSISYGPDSITYTKFDERSRERLKLGAWEPGSISGGEMTYNPTTRVLEVTASARVVTILRSK